MLARENKMTEKRCRYPGHHESGHSLIEVMIVLAIVSILSGIAIPQMVSQRRVTRSTAIPREITTQLRLARQLAMAERKAYTFQYDDSATPKRYQVNVSILHGGLLLSAACGNPAIA